MSESSATLVVRVRERLVRVSHLLSQSQAKRVAALAREKKTSRSEVIRELVDYALERVAA